jgi:hypothetical protein
MLQSSVKNVPADLLKQAVAADIVTFGSPSAVKAWVALVGQEVANNKVDIGRDSHTSWSISDITVSAAALPSNSNWGAWPSLLGHGAEREAQGLSRVCCCVVVKHGCSTACTHVLVLYATAAPCITTDAVCSWVLLSHTLRGTLCLLK